MAQKYTFTQRLFARLLSNAQKRAASHYARTLHLEARPHTTDREQLYDVTINKPYILPLSFAPRAVVDVGANVGFATVQLALRYPEAHVYAFEPEPGNFATAKRNTQDLSNVTVYQKVVTPFPDSEVRCYNCGGEWGFVFESMRPENEHDFEANKVEGIDYSTLETISMNQIVEQHALARDGHNLLKINIAGFEHEMFAGDLSWMDAFGALAVRVPWPMSIENQTALFDAIKKSGHPFEMSARNTLLFFQRTDIA